MISSSWRGAVVLPHATWRAALGSARRRAAHRRGPAGDRRERLALAANAADLADAEANRISQTGIDRLALDEGRLAQMADSLRSVAGLADPLGEIVDGWVRPNGLRVQRVRVPLGVVGVIYENRPNVTTDAAALCLKSGNAAFLRVQIQVHELNQ